MWVHEIEISSFNLGVNFSFAFNAFTLSSDVINTFQGISEYLSSSSLASLYTVNGFIQIPETDIVGQAGSIRYRNDTITFLFNYGYDEQAGKMKTYTVDVIEEQWGQMFVVDNTHKVE